MITSGVVLEKNLAVLNIYKVRYYNFYKKKDEEINMFSEKKCEIGEKVYIDISDKGEKIVNYEYTL